MKGIECASCHGMCDPGELVGGICDECREEEYQRMLRRDSVTRIMGSPFYQMELRFKGGC